MTKRGADWMGDLKAVIGDQRLDQIIIPGTHDSATAALDISMDLAPGAPKFLFHIRDALHLLVEVIEEGERQPESADGTHDALEKWAWHEVLDSVVLPSSRAQSKSIAEQLQLGIRYFDLRVSPWKGPGGEELRITHAIFGNLIAEVLSDIAAFAADHPHEILILDFQHFDGMSPTQIASVADLVVSSLGTPRLAPNSLGTKVTPKALWANGQQVIAVVSEYAYVPEEHKEYFWDRSKFMTSQWVDTDSTKKLLTELGHNLEERAQNPQTYFVLQGVLTFQRNLPHFPSELPTDTGEFLVYLDKLLQFFHDLTNALSEMAEHHVIEKFAEKATPKVAEAMVNQWAHLDQNIVMVDFFEKVDFLGIVEQLNRDRGSALSSKTSEEA